MATRQQPPSPRPDDAPQAPRDTTPDDDAVGAGREDEPRIPRETHRDDQDRYSGGRTGNS